MMDRTIEIAEYAGVCFGVQRALDMARKVAENATGPVHTIGPLIHNPIVVDELERNGVHSANDVQEIEEGTAIVRAHGVPPIVYAQAEQQALEIVDATCPYVKRVQLAAKKLSQEHYQVLILGEPDHPEVQGIKGNAGNDAIIVQSVVDLSSIHLAPRVGLVVQTTQTQELLDAVVTWLLPRVKELHVCNTICSATQERQDSARSVSARSDVMIVIGGKQSGNTRRLAQLCYENCPRTHHIQSADELDPSWFATAHHIGVTAGASTPKEHIDAVVRAIDDMGA